MEYVFEEINKRHQVEERLPSCLTECCVQHVIQHGNTRDIIFVAEEDYRFLSIKPSLILFNADLIYQVVSIVSLGAKRQRLLVKQS